MGVGTFGPGPLLLIAADVTSTQNVFQRAEHMLAAGQASAAQELLRSAANSGDREVARALATAYLTGQPFGRDLARSRQYFELAANLGDEEAREVFIAFLAKGTGGERDWPRALELLEAQCAQRPDCATEIGLISEMDLQPDGSPTARPIRQAVAALEGAAIFRSFMTADECGYLMRISEPLLHPSMVMHPQTRQLIADPIRTSDAAGFPLVSERPFVHAINRRIAAASATTPEQGETLQLLRYQPGQQYKLHHDALPEGNDPRILTFLVYLNDDYAGGETAFPDARFEFKGGRGDALMFRNMLPDGQPDLVTKHIGKPVTSGTKFLASKWIRAHPIDLTGGR